MRLTLAAVLATALLHGQAAPTHGHRPGRLLVRRAMLVEGNGTPAFGPRDLLIENGRIAQIVASPANAAQATADAVIDAAGKYVLPGFVNLHAHLQEERAGRPMLLDYELKLWLACGITTCRDVGSNTRRALEVKRRSAAGELAAPRLFVYPVFSRPPVPTTGTEARQRVRELHAEGADGIKFFAVHRDVMQAMLSEAKALGLRTAHHAAIAETNAWDDIRFGTTSIEHWYGIPDAALREGVQQFPAGFNHDNELDRFRYAGRLWREADPQKLDAVLDAMAKAGVAWDPTLNIYEASRDLQRAQTQPWFAEYLHPALAKFFRPNLAYHGSFFTDWTTTDEIFWKENYQLWFRAVREFARRGGVVGVGEDTGFIYQLYGFGLLRGLELHQEAGFHPLQVIQHATVNGARILGQEDRLGQLRVGYAADLIVVNGNPLENLKLLYPTGVEVVRDGQYVRTGGIEWTVKDGYCYHGPTLLREVREIVAKARAERQ